MRAYLTQGVTYCKIKVDEALLEEVNHKLAKSFVMFEDVSRVPRVSSIEELKTILRKGIEDSRILHCGYLDMEYEKRFSDSLYMIVYDIVTDVAFNTIPYLIDDENITSRDIEFEWE